MTTVAVLCTCAGIALAPPVGVAHGADVGSANQPTAHVVQNGSTVTVYVQTESGDPIRNARVRFTQSGSVVAEGYTDSFGSLTRTVPSDEYTITVQAGGVASDSKVVTVEEDTVVEFTLAGGDGASVGFVDYSMSVQGRHTGCPLDANYEIQNTGDVPYSESGSVGQDGQFATKLPVPVAGTSGEIQPTPYRLIVSKSGYETLDTNRSVDNATNAQVSLDPDKGDITVDVSAEIAGEYEPGENAMVTIRGRCRNTNAIAVQEQRERVDETGTVTFDRLPPADYTVIVEKHGYRNNVSAVTIGPDESKQVSARLNLSQPSTLSMAVDEQLNFTAAQHRSEPLAEATLTISYRNEDHQWERATDASGEFTLEQLPPGQYSVTVEKETEQRQGARVGWQSKQVTTNLSLDEDKTVAVDLHRNLSRIDTTAVDREKFPQEPLTEKLRTNGPAASVPLTMKHVETGTVISVTTDQAGGLTQALPTGAYEVWTDRTVDREPKTDVPIRTNLVESGADKDSGTPESPARLHLDDGADWTPDTGVVFVPRLDTLVYDVYQTIDDPAEFFEEKPVINATVTVTDSEGDTFTRQTNFHGKIIAPRVSPGEATVEIQKDGYETTTDTVEVGEWSDGQSGEQLANGRLNVTVRKQTVPVANPGYFEFTVQEWDNCVEDWDGAGNPFCDGEEGFVRDSGWLIVTHRGERIGRFSTNIESGDRLGPFPEGDYEVYLQDDTHDEREEHLQDTCKADERVYQLNPTLDGGSTTQVAFKYDRNETEAAPDEMPVMIRIVNSRTDEPIETQGTAAQARVDNVLVPDYCDWEEGSGEFTTRQETDGSPFETDGAGRPLDRQFINPLIHFDFTRPAARFDNVAALDRPYAAVADELDVSITPGDIWTFHFRPNAAEVTGSVSDTETGDPLSNVSVSLSGAYADETGTNGEYAIAGVPNGEYQMTFSKEKYYSETRAVTVDEVTAGGEGDGFTTVTKPAGQPVQMEPLPEPRASTDWPIQGTFLDDVGLRYEWNVTIEEWALDTSRPGGDDAIESIDFYVQINGTERRIATKQVEVTPDDLPREYTTNVSITDLTDDLSAGEYREIDGFYVNLTTRRLGDLQYRGREGTGTEQATIVATPPWLAVTHTLVRESQTELEEEIRRKKETAVSDIRDVLEGRPVEAKLKRKVEQRLPDENVVEVEQTTIRNGLGGSLTGRDVGLVGVPMDLPDIYQAQGVGFTAKKTGASARYEVGYKLMTGITYPLTDNVREKIGWDRIGLPRADAAMWLNGTIDGQRSEWDSQAQAEATVSALVSDHYTTLPGPFAMLPFNVASGEAELSYEEESSAALPESETEYESAVTTDGSMRIAVWDIIEMAADIKTAGAAELAPPYADVLLDWNVEATHDGSGPPFKNSKSPVMVTDGDGYPTPHNASVGVEMRYGVAAAERGIASVGGCGYDFGRLAKNVFSKATGVNAYAPCGIDVKLVNLSSSYPYFERMDGEMTLLSVEGEVLGGAVLGLNGSKRLWEEPINLQLGAGSPSTAEFTEIPTSVATLDRWWLSLPNYGTATTWSQRGRVVNSTYPYADPATAIHDGEVELLAGTDTGGEDYATSLALRRFSGTVFELDETDSLPESTGGLSPAVAVNDTGDGALAAFSRLASPDSGSFRPATLQTSELYVTERTDGSWGTPQAVTDNAAFDHAATVVDAGDGYFVAWKASHGTPLNGTHTSVEYALVEGGSVQERGTVVENGVTSEPAVACSEDGCLVATTVREVSPSGSPSSSVVYSLVSDGTATDPETIDGGSLVDAAATADGFDVVFGDPGGIDHVHIVDGTVSEPELVADVVPRDLAMVAGSDGPLVVWSNTETAVVEYSEFDGTEWTDSQTLVSDEFHTSVAATVDPETGTTLVTTTSTGVSTEDSAVHLNLYTLDSTSVPPIAGENPPTDPDGDGLYEDIDGDGEFDIFDVRALFTNLDNPDVTGNPQFFNFDGDESGAVDIFDVRALFTEFSGD